MHKLCINNTSILLDGKQPFHDMVSRIMKWSIVRFGHDIHATKLPIALFRLMNNTRNYTLQSVVPELIHRP